MKNNKLIINIVLVYFVLLAIVLAVQFKLNTDRGVATEPLKGVAVYNDVLSDSIVMYDRSPVMLVKQRQMLVDGKNAACVPFIEKSNVFVPISFFETAYGAVVSYDKGGKSATVRLNNKALVSDNVKDTVMLISASGETQLSDKSNIVFKNDNAYIPLSDFVDGFGKKMELYDGMIVLSDGEINIDEADVEDFVSTVEPQVKNLPSVDEKKKLEELLGTGAVSLFNGFGGDASNKNTSPVSSLGLDAMSVDEPVKVKTDGSYVYTFADDTLNIYSAKGDNKLEGSVKTDLKSIDGIYVYGDYVAVIGSGNATRSNEVSFNGCIVALYDVTDRANPVLARTIAAEGSYLSAHKKDNMVYLFVRKTADKADVADIPAYYDSANELVGTDTTLSDVRYVPEMLDKAYTSVVGFCINDMSRTVNISTILGCGNNFSLTGESLYIAAGSDAGTSVYRFALSEGSTAYASVGYTEGNVPDSTCMNEYDGIFRLASVCDDDVDVILMDDEMDETERLDGIKIDGKLAGARFIGGRGYLVGDGKSAPIYALDLSDKAKELGAINISEDVIAVRNFDAEHFICFKADGSMSMLNIADMDNQKEDFSQATGGSIDIDNVLLKSDEALLFVPITLEGEGDEDNVSETVSEEASEETTLAVDEQLTKSQAPEFTADEKWQGVCVYSVDTTNNAFALNGVITHITDKYNDDERINAMTYSDGKLYTVSENGVKVNEISK